MTLYTCLIGGHIANIMPGTLHIGNSVGKRSVCNVTVYDVEGKYHYQSNEDFIILDESDHHVFAGFIDSPREQFLGREDMLITKITGKDYHYLADKRVTSGVYVNLSCGAIVEYLLKNVLASEGVVAGYIQAGPVLPEFVANYDSVAKCMDKLATAAGFWWAIDPYKRLRFCAYTTTPAPWAFTNGDQAEYGSIYVTRNNPAYRNKQFIIGAVDRTKTQTEFFECNGKSRAWVTRFAIATQPDIYLNGVKQEVGGKGTDTGKDFYWTQGDPVIAQDIGEATLTSSDDLKVVYTGQFPVVVVSQNNQQIAQQKIIERHTSGIVEEVEQDLTVTNRAIGLSRIRQFLAHYAAYGTSMQFVTRKTGLEPGQILNVTFPQHELFGAEMLIESVAIDDRDGMSLWQSVNAILGPYDVTWVDFYADLLRKHVIAVDQANLTIAQITDTIIQFNAQISVSATWDSEQSTALICQETSSICGGRSLLVCGLLICGSSVINTTPHICGNSFICGANATIAGNSTICG